MTSPLFAAEDYRVTRGATPALIDLRLAVGPGEIVGIVGRNGAGKTSLLEGMAGLHSDAGALWCRGRPLAGLPTAARLQAGLALCPEGRSLFASMTVEENLRLGAWLAPQHAANGRLSQLFDRFPLLTERRAQMAGSLSGGEQQIVVIARALASEPQVLLLDGPTAGLAPRFRATIADTLRTFAAAGGAVLIADDNLEFLLAVVTLVLALSGGREVFRHQGVLTTSEVLERLLAAESG